MCVCAFVCVCVCVHTCAYMCLPRSLVKASEVPDHNFYHMLLAKWSVLEQSGWEKNSVGVVAKEICLICHATKDFFCSI